MNVNEPAPNSHSEKKDTLLIHWQVPFREGKQYIKLNL